MPGVGKIELPRKAVGEMMPVRLATRIAVPTGQNKQHKVLAIIFPIAVVPSAMVSTTIVTIAMVSTARFIHSIPENLKMPINSSENPS